MAFFAIEAICVHFGLFLKSLYTEINFEASTSFQKDTN